jgi:hypothetical protein
MPEMDIYITDEERMELFEYVRDNDGVFIPNETFDKPETIQIQSKEELIKCIYEQVTSFFVLSPRFQTESLRFGQFEVNDEKYKDYEYYEYYKGKYYIMQRYGGPYISLSFYRGFADDAIIKYKSTVIDHYARYIHKDTLCDEFRASEELKEYYKMLTKFLKSKCRRITAKNGKKYLVSKTLDEKDIL